MFVTDTLTATQIPAFKNIFKKLKISIDIIPDTLLKTQKKFPNLLLKLMADIPYASKKQPHGIMRKILSQLICYQVVMK